MFDRDAHKDEVRPIPNGEFEAIQLEDIPTRLVKIGSMLPFKVRFTLIECLGENKSLFAISLH